MKQRLFDLAKLLASLLLLAYVLSKVDLQKMLAQLRAADLSWFVLGLLLFLFGVYLRAFRWRALLVDRLLPVPISKLTQLYFIGQFFNTFLPTGFGGDVIRMVELARYGVSKAEAVSTVFLDRFSGLMAFFVMTLIALPFASVISSVVIPTSVMTILLAFGLAGIVGTCLMFERRWTTPLLNNLFARFQFPFKVKVVRLYETLRANSPRATAEAMLIGFAFNLLLIAINYLVSRALNQTIDIGYFFLFVPIISTALLLPLPNGLGVRENVYVLLFGSIGVSHESAVLMSLLFWTITMLTGLVGGVLYAAQGARGALRVKDKTS
jgi:hypothetical protein